MFFHNLKYELLIGLRKKETLFWLILFPIVLGSFFKIAFAGIYDKTVFTAVPIAVVQTEKNETFDSVIKQVSTGKDSLFKVTFTDEKKALQMLKDEKCDGIIYSGSDLSLTVASKGIKQTIIKTFVSQYKLQEKIITDTITSNPESVQKVISQLSKEVKYNNDIKLTEGNTDNTIQYFYNLLAMVALLGSMSGLSVAIGNQGNLSNIGARKCISPTNKAVSITASLCSCFIIQTICMLVAVTFICFVLKIDFGNRLPLVYLSSVMGGILGVSCGFFIGSIGRMGENAKIAVAMTFSMLSCFLSGLMIGNLKGVIAEHCPIINEINPAAVISDTFYCLNIYSDYRRFTEKIIVMAIMIFAFGAGGFLLSRRRKYESL